MNNGVISFLRGGAVAARHLQSVHTRSWCSRVGSPDAAPVSAVAAVASAFAVVASFGLWVHAYGYRSPWSAPLVPLAPSAVVDGFAVAVAAAASAFAVVAAFDLWVHAYGHRSPSSAPLVPSVAP